MLLDWGGSSGPETFTLNREDYKQVQSAQLVRSSVLCLIGGIGAILQLGSPREAGVRARPVPLNAATTNSGLTWVDTIH